MQKCFYCDFASHANREHEIDSYLDSLEEECVELLRLVTSVSARTIYIGGGTPTVLNEFQFERLLTVINKYIKTDQLQEFTVEANPGTLSKEKLQLMKRMQVNRISMGVQSLQHIELQILGRIHSVEDVFNSITLIKDSGFSNWSVDLMYGIPGQTMDSWNDTLTNIIALEPPHISAYQLKVEEGTPFYLQDQNQELQLPSDDESIAMYESAKDYLQRNTYEQYEISNYSKLGYHSLHNMTYWNYHNYLGLGANAWGYISNIRYQNHSEINLYQKQYQSSKENKPAFWSEFFRSKVEYQTISMQMQMEDFVMMGLRKTEGISVFDFYQQYGVEFEQYFGKQIETMRNLNLLQKSENRYHLTKKGLLLSNEVISAFI